MKCRDYICFWVAIFYNALTILINFFSTIAIMREQVEGDAYLYLVFKLHHKSIRYL